MGKLLYTFDIFDTLITRRTATPEGIFALMQKRLAFSEQASRYPERIIRNFYILRIEAEKVARNTFITDKVKDITLRQIYECFFCMEEMSEAQLRELMALEVAVELENLLPIPENIERVRRLKESGERVVLVSNMYLNSEDIRRLLVQISPIFRDIPLYVSGELGKTKGTHTLYHYVREQEQVEFPDWHHYGDDWNLDVEIPRRMGIYAEHYKKPQLQSWEKELLAGRESGAELQLLLGLSKETRRSCEKEDLHFAYQVGCGFSAELLMPYVAWVLKESQRRKIRKLFFIARDGYILKKIADILIEGYALPVKTAYLYGSRKAWRLPSVRPGSFDIAEFFRLNYQAEICTYAQIGETLELTPEELKGLIPFARENGGELSGGLVREILHILVEEQEEVATILYEKQKGKREAAIGYLRQEIGGGEDFAFVDLIGSGYTQRCLAGLLEPFYGKPVKTFFYRLDCCESGDRNENQAFFPNRMKMGNVIEVLCGAPHGQTNGYERKEGEWIPVFGNDEGERLEEYGFGDYVRGIEDYTKETVRFFSEGMPDFQDLSVPAVYLEYMAQARNRELYDYIARMPYGITGKEKVVGAFAPQISSKDMRNLYLWHKGEQERKYYKGYSIEFSLMNLSGKQEKRLEFYRKHSEDTAVRWLRKHIFQTEAKVRTHRYNLIADSIILYGAGKRGRLLYRQLTAGKQYHADILLWVDRDFRKHQEEGLPVFPPEDIVGVDCRQIVIAVADWRMAEQIKESLMAKGAASSRILWIQPDDRIR